MKNKTTKTKTNTDTNTNKPYKKGGEAADFSAFDCQSQAASLNGQTSLNISIIKFRKS